MASSARTLRIATWNVHSCVGTDRRCDPERIARVIGEIDPDVLALQEFSYPADIALETRTPIVLTSLVGYQCALGPTQARRAQQFGNLVLTRHPIRELQRIDLSFGRREPRGALALTIETGAAELHVLSTHLGLRLGERRHQVNRILEHVASLETELLAVMGDFNDWLPGRSVVRALDERWGPAPAPKSFPGRWPLFALDRIWVHPSRALRSIRVHATPLARVASDHLPVVAEVDCG